MKKALVAFTLLLVLFTGCSNKSPDEQSPAQPESAINIRAAWEEEVYHMSLSAVALPEERATANYYANIHNALLTAANSEAARLPIIPDGEHFTDAEWYASNMRLLYKTARFYFDRMGELGNPDCRRDQLIYNELAESYSEWRDVEYIYVWDDWDDMPDDLKISTPILIFEGVDYEWDNGNN